MLAIVVSGLVILPALLLATYTHQGESPFVRFGALGQFLVVAGALALAVWAYRSGRLALSILSLLLVAAWVPLLAALAEG